jgi:ABC-type glycerol-3-phosphate transport system substrate-binding protein
MAGSGLARAPGPPDDGGLHHDRAASIPHDSAVAASGALVRRQRAGGQPAPTAAPAGATPPAGTPAPAGATTAKPAATTDTAAKPAGKTAAELRLHVRQAAEGTKTEAGIAAFQTANPGITVKLEAFPGDQYQEKMLTLGAGGTLGDVAFTHVGFYHQTAGGGFWADLDPFIKSSNFDMTQYYATGLDYLRLQGKLYALPYKGHSGHSALWYNKEMLAEAKADPSTLKNYDDLVAMAKSLTTPASGGGATRWGYLYAGHSGWELTAHMRAFGVESVEPLLGATKSLLDQPQQVAAITWYHDILHKHKITPLPGSQDYLQIFVAGTAGMRNGGLWMSGDQTAIGTRFRQEAVSMPKGPGGALGMFHNFDQMAMNAKSKAPDASWALLSYLCGKEHGIRLGLAEGGGAATPGARKDVYGSEQLISAVPSIKLFSAHMETAVAQWYAANLQTNKAWTTFKQALDKILLNPNPPTANDFKEANATVQSVLDEPRL